MVIRSRWELQPMCCYCSHKQMKSTFHTTQLTLIPTHAHTSVLMSLLQVFLLCLVLLLSFHLLRLSLAPPFFRLSSQLTPHSSFSPAKLSVPQHLIGSAYSLSRLASFSPFIDPSVIHVFALAAQRVNYRIFITTPSAKRPYAHTHTHTPFNPPFPQPLFKRALHFTLPDLFVRCIIRHFMVCAFFMTPPTKIHRESSPFVLPFSCSFLHINHFSTAGYANSVVALSSIPRL